MNEFPPILFINLKFCIMKKIILLFAFASALFLVAPVFAQNAIGFSNVSYTDGTAVLSATIFNTTGSPVDITFHCHGTITNGSPGFDLPYAFYFKFGTVEFNYNDYFHPSCSFTSTEQETLTIPPGETVFYMYVINDVPCSNVIMACMMDYVPGVTMTNSSVSFTRVWNLHHPCCNCY